MKRWSLDARSRNHPHPPTNRRGSMKAKILIVDDDPDIATMLDDRLQASDYGTTIARDGVEALELVEQEAPHLILLDLDMPRMTGLEVLKRLPKVRPAEDLQIGRAPAEPQSPYVISH